MVSPGLDREGPVVVPEFLGAYDRFALAGYIDKNQFVGYEYDFSFNPGADLEIVPPVHGAFKHFLKVFAVCVFGVFEWSSAHV